MARTETRDTIIEAGREIISQHGFGTTGINAVLDAAGVPKGSFYYYFSSKNDFGLAVIDAFAREYSERLDRILGDESRTPLARLAAYFDAGIADMEACSCTAGCLAGNLGQELAATSEIFRARLDRVFGDWETRIADCLRTAAGAGELGQEVDPDETAGFILAGWEGAILRAKVLGSTAPMKRFSSILFEHVLQPD